MTPVVEFFLPLTPIPKGNANEIHTSKPRRGQKRRRWIGKSKRSKDAGRALRLVSRQHLLDMAWPKPHPVRMDVVFVFEVPPSWDDWKKKAALDGQWLPTEHQLGDRDNLHKTIGDALEAEAKKGWQGFYEDDSQIVDGDVKKRYGFRAGYLIRLTFLRQAESPAQKAAGYDYPGKTRPVATFGNGTRRVEKLVAS